MSFTLKTKILVIATAVIMVAIGAVIVTSAQQSARDYEEALQSRSVAIAKSLAIQLERILQLGLRIDDIVGFEEQCNEVVSSYSGIELAFVADKQGRVVFHSDSVSPSLADELLQAVVTGHEGVITQSTNRLTWHNATMPAMDQENIHVASVIVSFPAQLVSSKIARTLWMDLWVGALVLISGLAILYLSLTHFVTSPLSELLSTVVTLRKAPLDLTRRASVETSDELGQLGTAFNQLMEELQNTTVSKAELEDAMLELQRLSAALAEQKEQVEVILQSIGDAVISVDNRTTVRFLNRAAERLCDWTLKDAEGLPLQSVFNLYDAANATPLPDPFEPAFSKNKAISNPVEADLQRRDGTTIAVDYTASPMHNSDGQINGGVLTLRDVSKERGLAQRLSWEASHDALTGLVNRREFSNRLEKAIMRSNKNHSQHVLCFMDLDRFKVVNDTAGHAAGDQLLISLSARMSELVRGTDTLARLGGDEFAVLLEDCPLNQAERISGTLLSTVEEFRFEHNTQVFSLGVSIGLAIVDGSAASEEILTMADTACYMAKEQGRNRICVYQTGNSDAYERRLQADWITRINAALSADRFTLYYQSYLPLNKAFDDREHLEVLVRMLDESNNIVLPASFLPAAERYGVMPNIDRWVIARVFSLYHTFVEQRDGRPLTCAINISGASLNTKGLLEFIEEKSEAYNIPERAICFEVTETIAINNLNSAIEFIQGCKNLGFLFALDDFGTGVSSFGYLKALPVDFLKIDGSFVKNITNDHVDKAMTETINRIGHIMGITTIAEYAETQASINMLREIGVDLAQGYGVHIPEPLLQ